MLPLNDIDMQLQRATAAADRSRYGLYASLTVVVSQLAVQAAAAPDPEADDLGADVASGIVNALTAPLLYASAALTVLFLVLTVVNHSRRTNLRAERAQMLGQTPPQPPAPPAPGDRPWRPQQ